MRSGKPNPFGADVVHMGEDGRDLASLAGWFGSPNGRVEVFDQQLVHAIIGGKDLNGGSAELSVNLGLTLRHGSLVLNLCYVHVAELLLAHE